MKSWRIELLPSAYKDLDEIFHYILVDNPDSAEKMLDKIMTSLNKLKEYPFSGPRLIDNALAHHDFRMIVIDPYVAFYRIINDTVYIYRILHSARDYTRILKTSK